MALLEEAQNASVGQQMPPATLDQTTVDQDQTVVSATQKPNAGPGVQMPEAEMPAAEMPAQQEPMVSTSIQLPESLAGADTTQLVQDATQNIATQQVRPEETVSGQMANLLGQDSTYMQMARAAGERQLARRGAQNTTMAGQAGEAAAIAASQPIAAADASVYNKMYSDKRMFDFDTVRQATQQSYDDALVRLEGAGRERLADIEGGWRSLMQTSASASDFLSQFQRDVAMIANNTQYSSAQQTAAINLLVSNARNSMQLMGDIGGIEGMEEYLTYLDIGAAGRNDEITEIDVTDQAEVPVEVPARQEPDPDDASQRFM